jgi:hypothetical protein
MFRAHTAHQTPFFQGHAKKLEVHGDFRSTDVRYSDLHYIQT